MGVPVQGSGPSTPWSDDGSGYDPGPYNLPNDGAQWSFVTVMYLLARIINSLGALYTGNAMQVPAYVGTQFTIAAGPLLTFLKLLANAAARVDASNTFNASQTFASTVTCSETLDTHGLLTTHAGLACDNETISGTLATGGASVVAGAGNVAIGGSCVITGVLTCNGNVSLNGVTTCSQLNTTNLAVSGTATWGALTASGLVTCQAGCTVDGAPLTVNGEPISFSGSQPNVSAAPGSNVFWAANICPFWIYAETDGSNGISYVSSTSGVNGGALSIGSASGISNVGVDFGTHMNDGNYHAEVVIEAPNGSIYIASILTGTKAANGFTFNGRDLLGGTWLNFATQALKFSVAIHARM